jgi:hypothetical protein
MRQKRRLIYAGRWLISSSESRVPAASKMIWDLRNAINALPPDVFIALPDRFTML